MSEQISEPSQPKVVPSTSVISSPEPESESRLRAVTFRGFELAADILHLVVGALLVIIAVAVILNVVFTNLVDINPLSKNASNNAIGLVDSVLFVVIVLELLDTVLTYLRDRTFALRPFLIIGIISSVRHILIIGAQLSSSADTGAKIETNYNYGPIVELMVSAVVALLLVICYWIVGKVSEGHES